MDVEEDLGTCNVCNGESKGRVVGVACVPGHAYSVLWCMSCLQNNAIPKVCAEINLHEVEYDLNNMADWAKTFTVWHDGKYTLFPEWAATVDVSALKARFEE